MGDQFDMVLVTGHGPSIHETSGDTKQVEVVWGIVADIGHLQGIPFHSFLGIMCHHEVHKQRNFSVTPSPSLWYSISIVAVISTILALGKMITCSGIADPHIITTKISIVAGSSIAAAIKLIDGRTPLGSNSWMHLIEKSCMHDMGKESSLISLLSPSNGLSVMTFPKALQTRMHQRHQIVRFHQIPERSMQFHASS